MWEIVGTLIGGFGLFFVGLHLLTQNLKLLSGRRFRANVLKWTRTPVQGAMLGGFLVIVTQSGTATTFILVGMMRSGLIAIEQALPVVIGMNALGAITLFIVAVDIRLAALFAVGIAGILYARNRQPTVLAAAGVAVGLSLLFLGLDIMRQGVAPMSQEPWFEHVIAYTQGSYLLGLVVGTAGSFVAQSPVAVGAVTVALQAAGAFSLEETIMVCYGANVGSSLLTYVLSGGLSGRAKQIAMFQTGYNIFGGLLMVPLFYLELYGDVPLAAAFISALTSDPGYQVAWAFMVFNFVPGVVLLPLLKPSARIVERLWPETTAETASQPQYLHDRAADDPVTAMELVKLEQIRLMGFLSTYLDMIRKSTPPARMADFQDAFSTLCRAIRETLSEISVASRLAGEEYERLNAMLTVQHNLENAERTLGAMAQDLRALSATEAGARFANATVEGLDTVLLLLIDFARQRDADDITMLETVTGDNGHGLKSVRSAYLDQESGLDADHRMQLLAAANHAERFIWLLGEIGHTAAGAPQRS